MGSRRRLIGIGLACAAIAAVVVGFVLVSDANGDTSPNAADIGFVQDMIDHHEQANQLALIALHGGASQLARDVAIDVLTSQRYEIGQLDQWLLDRHLRRGERTRTAMAWMGMHVRPATMPGMATQEQLDQLQQLHGAALDHAFFTLMIGHHQGGIHMAEAAAARAADPHIRWLAGQMARNQRREILEMQSMLATMPRGI